MRKKSEEAAESAELTWTGAETMKLWDFVRSILKARVVEMLIRFKFVSKLS